MLFFSSSHLWALHFSSAWYQRPPLVRQDGVSGLEKGSCTFLALSQLFLQLLIAGTEVLLLSLPLAQLQLRVLYLLPCILLEEVRREASPHRATAGGRQRGTNTQAETAKVGGGSWAVMVHGMGILLSPVAASQPGPQEFTSILAWALCLSVQCSRRTGFLGALDTSYQILLSLLQVLM